MRYLNWSSFNRSWSLGSSDFNWSYFTSHHRFSSYLSLRLNSHLSRILDSNLSFRLNSDLSLRLRLNSNLSFNWRLNSDLSLRLNSNLSLNLRFNSYLSLRLNSYLSLRLNSDFSLNRSRNSDICSIWLNSLWSWLNQDRTSRLDRFYIFDYNFLRSYPFLFIKRSSLYNSSLILSSSILLIRNSTRLVIISLNLRIIINNLNNFAFILIFMALNPTSNVIDSTMLKDTI